MSVYKVLLIANGMEEKIKDWRESNVMRINVQMVFINIAKGVREMDNDCTLFKVNGAFVANRRTSNRA